jgi:hypothetical protein
MLVNEYKLEFQCQNLNDAKFGQYLLYIYERPFAMSSSNRCAEWNLPLLYKVLFSAGRGTKEAENVLSHKAGGPIVNRV